MIKSKSKTKSSAIALDHQLHRRGYIFFFLFFVFVLWAFWSSYYSIIMQDMPVSIRFHGTTMTLWCLMLIGQAMLIRWKQFTAHRWIGRLSYFLVPFILFSGAHLSHITISQAQPGTFPYYYMAALMFNALIAFAILYGLAMWHRKNAGLHARYMVCTIFPLISPVTDRLIYKYFPTLIEYAPVIQGMPVVPALGYVLADLVVIVLLIWDYTRHRRWKAFTTVLIVLLLYHVSVLTFHDSPIWQSIVHSIMKLPFS
jgi:hypothetical protein